MTLVILAGGKSKRMWPLKTGKLAINFLGRPFFYYTLESVFKSNQFDKIVIIASPSNKDLLSNVAEELNVKADIVVQSEPKGMADAILSASDLVEGEVVIANADDLLEPKVYKEVVESARKSRADTVIAGLIVDKYFPGAYLKLNGSKITGIIEKPGEGNEPSNTVKLVVDYFKDGKKLISYLNKSRSGQDDIYEVALDKMIKESLDLRVVKYSGTWSSLKYPWNVLDITDHFLAGIKDQISSRAEISKTANIVGPVIIEDGVRVLEGATIKGPCFIGKNSVIGSNSLIRKSILGQNVVTGYSTEIAKSYVGDDSWFHTNYVGDSVVENNFGMGSGAVIANLRLDGKTIRVGEEKLDTKRDKLGLISGPNVRIGVNATTMPGVRIGEGSLVGPGVIQNSDIQEKSKILLNQKYTEGKNESSATYDKFRSKL